MLYEEIICELEEILLEDFQQTFSRDKTVQIAEQLLALAKFLTNKK